MIQAWKNKWLAALRSGKFKQGKEALKQEDCYCCLGVLCEISNMGKWDDAELYRTSTQKSMDGYPPPDVWEYVGLTGRAPKISISLLTDSEQDTVKKFSVGGTIAVNEGAVELATLNDSGFTFERIAQLIEEGIIGE